jgi:hypothetical protein
MQKHLFYALFLIVPASLALTAFAQSAASVQHAPFSVNISTVATDSVPVEKKSSAAIVPISTKQTQVNADSVSRSGFYKNNDPAKLKANNVDTTGFIYDLNAFYHIGK